ncbi:MAG: STAS domain-containing protein [Lentisphaerae bacterium]|nr:STAS domain-containing protein [Lentisphaerota bacterium]MCP4102734.1 STAS domain-containing protein [Lentisphaerota bacterium]
MQEGNILYAVCDEKCIVKFVGNIRYTIARGFQALIDEVIAKPKVKEMLVDLTQTEYIDSTCLGLMAKMANLTWDKCKQKITLLSNNGNINYLLDSIGFGDVFLIVDDAEAPLVRLTEIPKIGEDQLECAKIMLEAHRQLMKLNAKNENEFKDVVTLLEKDLHIH